MRRMLSLDGGDLVMVVKEDVVKQIDEYRGEMNRTEFVNYLIQCQLKGCYKEQNYVAEEEFQHFCRQITGLMHTFLEFFVSYGIALNSRPQNDDLNALKDRLTLLSEFDEPK